MTNDNKDPNTNGIAKNKNIVAVYIGCLTREYSPVSITYCSSTTSIVLDKIVFCFKTTAYKI